MWGIVAETAQELIEHLAHEARWNRVRGWQWNKPCPFTREQLKTILEWAGEAPIPMKQHNEVEE